MTPLGQIQTHLDPLPRRRPSVTRFSAAPPANSIATLQELVAVLSAEFINLPTGEIDRAITDALRRIGEIAEVDRTYVFAIDGDCMSNTNEWRRNGTKSRIDEMQNVPISAYPRFMSRILDRQAVHIARVADLPEDKPDKALLMAEGIRSLLAVPIVSRSHVIGFVGFDVLHGEKQWTSETTTFLKIVGTIFGNALDRRNTEHALVDEKEFFSNVFETSATLVIVLAPDGHCLRVNRAFRELTGGSHEELSGTGWQQFIPEEAREGARRVLRNALDGHPVQFESPLLSRDHDTRTILWTGAVICTHTGQPQYVVVTGTDATETLTLREQVEQVRRLDSLGRVAATIAHEFNNVLMAIQPSADLIRRFPDRHENVQRAAERIDQAVKRGVKITTEVTRFARPSDPVRRPIEVNAWMESLAEEMRAVLRERVGSEVLVELSCNETAHRVLADADQLHQVFSNLILNAADAIPSGGKITVSIEEVTTHRHLHEPPSDGIRWVHCEVRDTGVGIAPAVLERIFEPLFTTKKKGTGLGLAVVHRIIKAHGGDLSVETAVGCGTTFHVFLRCAAGMEDSR